MTRKYFDLAGKHALVTAATTPLASALSMALSEAGARVSLTTLRDDAAELKESVRILAECVSSDLQGQTKGIDLTDPTAVENAVNELEDEVSPIDILVNGAHCAEIKPVLESTLEDWLGMINLNATSTFVASQAVGRRIIQRGGKGRIVNLVSITHDRGVPNCALFGASQGAVLGFTKSLGLEWGRRGVTVNAIGLGFIDELDGPQNDNELHNILQRYIPVARTGTPEDLKGVVVYLVSDEAAFVNAELFTVDGALVTHG
ncbi:MAG: SDR family oxidoreductase [Pseudomonadales bacterium]|jgi:gluconate 5-dehydrogenase|nr:SDR family oxidoreductase [Pseudomonadales bacterium]MDP7360264.1 SDR family oxidoreductase [Pseudomonadales bacterium]MDP7597228.1 SDR family oxidoreductase [Pseudomonadales bacterium]HJN52404.1 SDR family oxidoreductase [Pseudomonadales bacterium]|tara:strand:+ start:2187 stop:2966 length:780 start_codon:yes stop_codon:yes gene_type:complete